MSCFMTHESVILVIVAYLDCIHGICSCLHDYPIPISMFWKNYQSNKPQSDLRGLRGTVHFCTNTTDEL